MGRTISCLYRQTSYRIATLVRKLRKTVTDDDAEPHRDGALLIFGIISPG